MKHLLAALEYGLRSISKSLAQHFVQIWDAPWYFYISSKGIRFQKKTSVNHVSQNKMLYCFWPVQGIYKYKKTWRQDELNFNSKSNSNSNSDYKANDDFEENPDKIWALIGSANIKGWKD